TPFAFHVKPPCALSGTIRPDQYAAESLSRHAPSVPHPGRTPVAAAGRDPSNISTGEVANSFCPHATQIGLRTRAIAFTRRSHLDSSTTSPLRPVAVSL